MVSWLLNVSHRKTEGLKTSFTQQQAKDCLFCTLKSYDPVKQLIGMLKLCLFSPDAAPHTQSQGFVLNTDHTPLLYFFQFKNLLISLCAM